MGKTRAQRRVCDGEISLYPAETILGWRVVGTTTHAKAADKLTRGEWRVVEDEQHNFLGYQVLAAYKKDEDLPSGASSSSITVNEAQLNAGLHGRSRTTGMSEDERISRRSKDGKALPPEDAIERAREKVMQWPFPASRIDDGTGKPVFGDKAVRIYPKVK
jgi:hypothetical protein